MFELVWFKKDLRVTDHQALYRARRRGPVLGLFVLEDDWLKAPEFSNYHMQFAADSLLELQRNLKTLNIPFLIIPGEVVEVLSMLHNRWPFQRLYSHQETGAGWTYARDKRVIKWCAEKGVEWHEFLQFATIRRLRDRDIWNKKRVQIIERGLIPNLAPQALLSETIDLCSVRQLSPLALIEKRNPFLPRGGRSQALLLLQNFLSDKVMKYQKGMSSPLTAYDTCSRLSAHITWGTLSLSEIQHRLKSFKSHLSQKCKEEALDHWRGLKSFESRLWWHCHFMQKLEDEPEIEFKNMNPAFDGLREHDFNIKYFEAWKRGETGFPIVDACMRSLTKTGWLNFRMRAMLISFASYQLWLHWKETSRHLAKLFVDFEPGIHYSQVQMQSGVTGINAIRIYSPIKQSMDQDPDGLFIKEHCPELEGLDSRAIHWPHDMPPLLQQMTCPGLKENYPPPIVDPKASYQSAKERIYGHRQRPEVKEISKQVYLKHGSRKNRFFPRQKRQTT